MEKNIVCRGSLEGIDGDCAMRDFSCDVCYGNMWKPVYRKKILHPLWWLSDDSITIDLNYIICQECGYITLFPRMRPDEYEKYYRLAPTPSQDAFPMRAAILEERKAFILNHINGSGLDVVVEVGSAYGDFLLLLKDVKKRVGIEPSSTYCEFIESSNIPVEYYQCVIEDVPENAPELISSADLAVASNVLEHAFDPRDFIRNLSGLVRPDGHVYIEVPLVEAMAECNEPVYQTIHFGHISQFSESVLNKLCISESLELVAMECSVKDNYPLVRALYKKLHRADNIEKLFRSHCDALDKQALLAKEILMGQVTSNNLKQTVVWGCGQDLLDVLNLLDDSELELLMTRSKIVDMNKDKQHKKLAGIEILDPAALSFQQIKAVVNSSRSKLIQHDIINNAGKIFPDAEIILLYP